MIDERTAQEIQSEVDGENLPEESVRVRDLIARDRDAAALYEELKELAEKLAMLPVEQPPEGLRRKIEGSAAWRAHGRSILDRRQLSTGSTGTVRYHHHKEGTVKGKYVIAGLAAAGIAAFVLYFGGIDFPPKSDEAAGTIGAVKKHRVEQISEGDVVLGTTESDSDWVPFADFIDDSAAFGSFSSRLEAASRKLQAKEALNAKAIAEELQAIGASLEARESRLAARAHEAIQLQAREIASLAGAISKLGAKGGLDARRSEAISLEAKGLVERLQAREIDLAGARQKLGALSGELGRASKFDAVTLEASSKLESLSRSLEAKGKLDANSLQADLGAISATLEARSAELAAKILEARDSYIGMGARAQADLMGARGDLAAVSRQLAASPTLDAKSFEALKARASELQSRATELEKGGLVGMRGQFELAAKNHEALMGMKDAADLSSRLLARDADLQARDALAAFSSELGAKVLRASSFLGAAARNDLGAVERMLGARDAVFGAKTLEAMNAHLGAVSRTLASRASQLEAKQFQDLESKLGSLSKTLEARGSVDR